MLTPFAIRPLGLEQSDAPPVRVRAVTAVGLCLIVSSLDQDEHSRGQQLCAIDQCVSDQDRDHFRAAWKLLAPFTVFTESGELLEP